MPALLIYLLFGQAIAWRVLAPCRPAVKGWMGLVFGCIALMWMPCLAAFFLDFTLPAQITALSCAAVGTILLMLPLGKKGRAPAACLAKERFSRSDGIGALASALLTIFCTGLLMTHVLMPHEDGSLWVGQSTYGDLAMHLGFIESLTQQGTFPPQYSIYPGQQIDYPFLVDAASASLRFFALDLRWSVICPSVVMLFAVFYGFWLLADFLTEKLPPTLMAWLLFVFNGGFGFVLFLTGRISWTELLTGFYRTPTNLVEEDLRWVNVLCDMLIPQRTTMAGWCVVLPALYLLLLAIRRTLAGESARRETAVLGVLAGAMPMIHTHSFLALGVLSAGWFFAFWGKAGKQGVRKEFVLLYVRYGVECLLLALPQLVVWTFDAASTGNLLWFNPGWVHGQMPWLWFWVVNVGPVFLVMLLMMFFLRGDRARLFWGASALFLLANCIAFQPNPYDNNKLLYIWYMITDILVCQWLWQCLLACRPPVLRKAAAAFLVVTGTLSGLMTLLREAVSEYQLLSPAQVEAAQFIGQNTPPDSVFLTSTDHTNPVSVLTGRNIVCGSSLYLYYHGIDTSRREAQLPEMYAGGEAFERGAREYGIDYVYISSSETSHYAVNEDYFSENYDLIYDRSGILIFQISS